MKIDHPIICQECDAEFDVISELNEIIEYCPFCGEMILQDDDEDEYDEDE